MEVEKNSFLDIHLSNKGYSSDKWTSYFPIYESIFSQLVQPRAILEIGIQNGGSLNSLSKYFTQAKIVGCDVDPKVASLQFDSENIQVVIGDINQVSTIKKIVDCMREYDLIIDDGSHISNDVIKAFISLFPFLRNDGFFVIEDLHTSYWGEMGGGLFKLESAISFFKLLADVVNYDSWGVNTSLSDFFKPFMDSTGIYFDVKLLDYVSSITFYNSVCVIQKKSPGENSLGPRLVTGSIFPVNPDTRLVHLSGIKVPGQKSNPQSNLSEMPLLKFRYLIEENSRLVSEVELLTSQIGVTESSLSRRFFHHYTRSRIRLKNFFKNR